tara:strand:- start:10 stop:348 length:339 start_codon:yes stop_codon:yes gene_type:complete
MAINSDVEIGVAIERLGKRPNQLALSQSVPPHTILEWIGGDTRPTDTEINDAWAAHKAEVAATKYREDRFKEHAWWREQLDLLYKDIVAGKVDATGEFAKAIKAVKDKYPKP